MEFSSILISLFLSDLSVFLELVLLGLSFLYIAYELIWDSSSNLEVINSAYPLFTNRYWISSVRTSPVVRGRSTSGISYRGRSLKKQIQNKKRVRSSL